MTGDSREASLARSFEEHLADVNKSAVRLGYVLVATLMPAGFALDYITHPEHTWSFLWIRLGASVVALGLLALTFVAPLYKRLRIIIDSLMPVVPAAGIEVMILRLDGVHSEYYAGLNLVILAMAILFTWTWYHALAVSSIIALMWLVPAIPTVARGELDVPTFFNNAYFVALTIVIATSAVAIRYRTVRREFDARQALAQASNELTETLAQLREADRLKNEFFANVSHELRTPLTLIMAPVDEMIASTTGALRNGLDVVRRNAVRLLRMIDDLLDLARLDSGRLRLHVVPIELGEMISRIAESARPTARRNEVELEVVSPPPTNDVHGDPHRIEIILTNLIGNALKFTPKGGTIRVVTQWCSEHVVVAVEDSGPGVPPEQRERIFERFFQVYGSERRRHGGAGIGLSLARDLARLHRGDLTVMDGRVGARFELVLPLRQAGDASEVGTMPLRSQLPRPTPESAAPVATPSEESLGSIGIDDEGEILFERGRKPRILIAEDEDDLRGFLEAMLSRRYDVMAARDGAEALAMARAQRPDLVLTDVMMPGVSGNDLCRELKADPTLRGTPVIMLTAWSAAESALEGFESGADDFVAKPFHLQVLFARIRAHLTLRSLMLQVADRARLESAGMLAAGVAHEVRNPVNAISSAARVLAEGEVVGKNRAELFNVIIDGVQRIDQVVSALDDQVRPADGLEAQGCSVREGIRSTIRLLGSRCDAVSIHCDLPNDERARGPVRAFNQIFLNLLDNALRSGGKNIWVSVETNDDEVVVSVKDDGEGISPEHARRLFDPFFSARSSGDGTGLGLFLSHRLAREHGGDLEYRPREPKGAEFVVRLPRMEVLA